MTGRLLKAAAVAALLLATPSLPLAGTAPAFAQSAAATAGQAKLVEFTSREDLGKLAAQGKTVVFFYATWCPNCILTLSELSEKWAEVEPDLTLVIADYDRETELKAEYGVTYQDTFVLLDAEGNGVRLWNAGGVAGLNDNTRTQ